MNIILCIGIGTATLLLSALFVGAVLMKNTCLFLDQNR